MVENSVLVHVDWTTVVFNGHGQWEILTSTGLMTAKESRVANGTLRGRVILILNQGEVEIDWARPCCSW